MNMKKFWIFLFAIGCLTTSKSFAQLRQGTMMIHAGLDAFKTDNDPFKVGQKAQIGAEFNYFIVGRLPLNAGVEIQTQGTTALTLGLRYYIIKPIFLRFRGFLSKDTDVALGFGYSYFFNSKWAIEGIGDYYFKGGDLGLRVGFSRFFR